MRFGKAINLFLLSVFSLLAASPIRGGIAASSEMKKPEQQRMVEQQPGKNAELAKILHLNSYSKERAFEVKSPIVAIGLDTTTHGKAYATMGNQNLGIRSSLRINKNIIENTTTAMIHKVKTALLIS